MNFRDISPAKRAQIDQEFAQTSELLDVLVGHLRETTRIYGADQALADIMVQMKEDLRLSDTDAWSLLLVALRRLSELE